MQKQHHVGKIYICDHVLCVDNTGQFVTGTFIVLVLKQKQRKRELGPNAPRGM